MQARHAQGAGRSATLELDVRGVETRGGDMFGVMNVSDRVPL